MNTAPGDTTPEFHPSGQVEQDPLAPGDEPGRLAWKAIREERWADAERHAGRMSSDRAFLQAWRNFIEGRVLMKRRYAADAEAAFFHGAAAALLAPGDAPPPPAAIIQRLAALCLEYAGRVTRRRDRAADAILVHSQALRLRETWGTPDEQWETRISLGLDCITARNLCGARDHFNVASDLAPRCRIEPGACVAISASHLAHVLMGLKLPAEAVLAARRAFDARWVHDRESQEVPRAKLLLAKALLAQAEFALCAEPGPATALLDEAEVLLDSARRDLPAFSIGLSLEAGEAAALLDALRQLRRGVPRVD